MAIVSSRLLGEQRQTRGRRRVLLQQPPEDDGLGEHRRGLGERQRRVLVEDALAGGEREVHAVAELVREREHVAPARGVVEQHVGKHRRHGRGAEGAAPLGRAQRRIDPALVEEALGQRAQLSGERGVAVEHDLARLRKRERDLVRGDGRHAVVVGQPLHAEQPRLQPVPAARDLIAPANRLDQRLHRLVTGLVREVARRQPAGIAAQAVVGRLVGQQRVEQERARAQPRLQRRRHSLGGRAPDLAVG